MTRQPEKPSHVQRRQKPRVVSKHARAWSAVGKIVVWVCVIVIVEVAVGHTLQRAADNTASRADASEPALPMDIVYARGTCPALDQYVHRSMTIDELHDLQDQLCPILSEPQRTGN